MTTSYGIENVPLSQLGLGNLTIQTGSRMEHVGIDLIINGNVRHYHFALGAIPSHTEELKKGTFYLGRSQATELLAKLSNPPIDEDLAARLIGSNSAFDYGYRSGRRFRPEYFDCLPESSWAGSDGFKVLQNGVDTTMLYLCADATEGIDEVEVVESLVRLNTNGRTALVSTINSLLHPSKGLVRTG